MRWLGGLVRRAPTMLPATGTTAADAACAVARFSRTAGWLVLTVAGVLLCWRILGPPDPPLSRTGPGRYEAIADLPLAGRWTVDVSVRLTKYDNPVTQIPVEIR